MEAVIIPLLLAVLALICGYRLIWWLAQRARASLNSAVDEISAKNRHELD